MLYGSPMTCYVSCFQAELVTLITFKSSVVSKFTALIQFPLLRIEHLLQNVAQQHVQYYDYKSCMFCWHVPLAQSWQHCTPCMCRFLEYLSATTLISISAPSVPIDGVDGSWSNFGEWSDCGVSAGRCFQTREEFCKRKKKRKHLISAQYMQDLCKFVEIYKKTVACSCETILETLVDQICWNQYFSYRQKYE